MRAEHEPSNLHDEVGSVWKSNIGMKWVTGFAALRSLTRTMLSILDGPLDYHTSICGGLFAKSTTSEQAVSCVEISGDAILASTND